MLARGDEMLLALFADFWTLPWPQAAPVTPQPKSPTDAGSGHLQDIPQEEIWPDRAPDDYWEAREAFLMRHMPLVPAPYVAEEPKAAKVVEKHNRVLELAARVVVSKAHLINVGKVLRDLEQQLQHMEMNAEDEAIEILLLM